ncbi:MAG: type II secretion system protein GspL [Gammaproteobacteria bacterium]
MKKYLAVIPRPAEAANSAWFNAEYAWAEIDERRAATWRHGSVAELKRLAADRSIIVIANAEGFRLIQSALPGKSRQQIELAARYGLEDDIASEIENVDVFVSEQMHDGTYTVAIADRAYLDNLIAPLAKQGLEVRKIIPDALLLDYREASMEVLIDGARGLVKFHENLATAVNTNVLPQLLARLKREHQCSKLHCLLQSNHPAGSGIIDKIRLDDPRCDVQVQSTNKSAREYLLEKIIRLEPTLPNVDLIPVRWKETRTAATQKTLWRIAAGLLVAAVLTNVTLDWRQIKVAERELAATREAQQTLIKSAFPNIGRLVNPEAQVQRELRALEKVGPPPAEFLKILTQSLLVPERNELQISLTGITFADGVLLLRTKSDEMGVLEKYRESLNEVLTAEVVTAESTNDVVRGAIRITR